MQCCAAAEEDSRGGVCHFCSVPSKLVEPLGRKGRQIETPSQKVRHTYYLGWLTLIGQR